jgi:allantoate deiminase
VVGDSCIIADFEKLIRPSLSRQVVAKSNIDRLILLIIRKAIFMLDISRVEGHIKNIRDCSLTFGGAGVTRLSFSEEYVQACKYLINYAENLGLFVSIDKHGNIFFELEGSDVEKNMVIVGSHIDSVKNGGHLDGVLGVVCGLESIESLIESGFMPKSSIVLAIFIEEEGVSFKCPMAGSKLFTGYLSLDDKAGLKNYEGQSFSQLVDSFISKLGLPVTEKNVQDIRYMLELHIEQGPVLESEAISVGIIQSISGSYNYKVKISGESGHAGTVPMGLRLDALACAAEIILDIEKYANSSGIVATVGYISCTPNATNTVPGEVFFNIDMRSSENSMLETSHKIMQDIVSRITTSRGLTNTITVTGYSMPVELSSVVVEILESSAHKRGIATKRMKSGALHDTAIIGRVCEAGMIFVPSRNGISHNPKEWTDFKDVEPGLSVLFDTLRKVSG